MRLTILSLIGAVGLAVAASTASAAPFVPEGQANPVVQQAWGGCGPGFRPVPGHWSRFRGWVPPHCAPNYRPYAYGYGYRGGYGGGYPYYRHRYWYGY